MTVTIGMPYYNQPEMLALHYDLWTRYANEGIKFKVIICDDGSQAHPAIDVPGRPDFVSIYKITKDRPWNWHAARNICIKEAEKGWLILTDIDHIVSGQAIRTLPTLDTKKAYNFTRWDYDTMKQTLHPRTFQPKPHPNTWAMTTTNFRKLYYDERWSGVYGGDGSYAARARSLFGAPVILVEPIYRVPRATCSDASGEGARRKQERSKDWRNQFKRKLDASGGLHAYVSLSQEYLKQT